MQGTLEVVTGEQLGGERCQVPRGLWLSFLEPGGGSTACGWTDGGWSCGKFPPLRRVPQFWEGTDRGIRMDQER